jgi:hypothetical protein
MPDSRSSVTTGRSFARREQREANRRPVARHRAASRAARNSSQVRRPTAHSGAMFGYFAAKRAAEEIIAGSGLP